MHTNDYLARIEQAVRDNTGGARVIGLIEKEINEREGYWERIYYVAWVLPATTGTHPAGTHQANIDSENRSALFYGHYQLTERDALGDLVERANLSPGRI